ncbi:MAG: DUF4832 domain-containing protein, partial [Verrucomicrobiota bacterium]
QVYDWAVREKHIAPRRDGVCGNSDGAETASGRGIAPGVFELYGSYDTIKGAGWWEGKKDSRGLGFRLEDCIENGAPTWVDLGRGGQPGLRMVTENRTLIARLTNRIGYHFELSRAAFRSQAGQGDYELRLTWVNRGVAPIYLPCAVAVAVFDQEWRPIRTFWPADCHPDKWQPGQPVEEALRLGLDGLPAGKYRLGLSITRKTGDPSPYIQLGSVLPKYGGWYVLGEFEQKH